MPDATGTFNKFAFDRYLNLTGQSEEEIIEKIKIDIIRRQIFNSISSEINLPKSIIEKLYLFREEKRNLEYIQINPISVDVQKPSEDELRSFYEKNKNLYKTNELRSFSYINISPEKLSKEIKVSKQEISERYEQEKNIYFEPEKRSILQIITNDEIDILKLEKDLSKLTNSSMAEIKNKLPKGLKISELNDVIWSDLPREIADKIFLSESNVWSKPFKSSLGWHLVYTKNIKLEGIIPLKEISKIIESKIQLDKAFDTVYQISNQLEDELASGKDLKIAGKELGLDVIAVSLIDIFLNENNKTNIKLPTEEKFIQKVFSSNKNDGVQTLNSEKGEIIYFNLEKVIPKKIKTFNEAKKSVETEWKFAEQKKLAKEKGEDIFDKIQSGSNLKEISKSFKLNIQKLDNIKRSDINKVNFLSKKLIEKIFLAEKNENIGLFDESSGIYIVANILKIKSPDYDTTNKDYLRTRQYSQTSVSNDLIIMLNNAFRDRFKIKIYNNNIDKINFNLVLN